MLSADKDDRTPTHLKSQEAVADLIIMTCLRPDLLGQWFPAVPAPHMLWSLQCQVRSHPAAVLPAAQH